MHGTKAWVWIGEMTTVDSEGFWTVTFGEDITEEFGFGAVHRDVDNDGTLAKFLRRRSLWLASRRIYPSCPLANWF